MSSGTSLVESLFRLGRFKEILAAIEKRPDQALTTEQMLIVAEVMTRTRPRWTPKTGN